ncbi:hypothetical protein [Pseudofulvimonas gallinarii]|jgi:hypothetical protein|uniref:Uncharacterized protein n=1 Tax=Pseudofulvimonas gallinarii TaxID=634155 RepID=A0A4R3LNR4_9GAMM|nr:hypothetical protein EDC25_101203 [Pseudofulvimonas gallinarii]
MRIAQRFCLPVALLLASSTGTALAQQYDCQMRFEMSGWSAFFKTASGHGTVTCNNGQRMSVRLSAKGGGITFGRSSIEDGRGEFSGVRDISEVLGSYVSAEAHAGAVRSAKGQVVTKGEVSLALSGTGRGWDLGVAFGKFSIERAR